MYDYVSAIVSFLFQSQSHGTTRQNPLSQYHSGPSYIVVKLNQYVLCKYLDSKAVNNQHARD